MPNDPSFAVQVFQRAGRDMVFGSRLPATSAEAARETAAEIGELFGGAAALSLVHDEEGALTSATIIATIGDVPPNWTDRLLASSA